MSNSQESGPENKGKDNIYHPTTSSPHFLLLKAEFSAASEMKPFLPFSRHPQGILSIVLKRIVSTIRNKAQVAVQHTPLSLLQSSTNTKPQKLVLQK